MSNSWHLWRLIFNFNLLADTFSTSFRMEFSYYTTNKSIMTMTSIEEPERKKHKKSVVAPAFVVSDSTATV